MDLYSKNLLIFIFTKYDNNSCGKALENAYYTQKPSDGLILHTDLGTQYTRPEFQTLPASYKIKPSFSKKGCPYDNACIESFHAILKEKRNISYKTFHI
ncbi:DDE-type integrase/transposase/recombinase [Bacillus wiedmannii]|uniref:DDE-type integrase/transposase/recombinase n=1 Tax=Bacillus wiedmannii TaxID=1890302 RepID=UPI000BFBFA1B|nr:hypothetical protein COE69_17920 [Bacillus wiedmannii]